MTDKNPVFDLLEVETDDIQNMVAYALYKRHKREWARGIREKTGSDPTPEQDAEFAGVVATESSLQRFRDSAGNMLVAFANQVVDEERDNIEEEAVPKRVETALQTLERSGSFKNQVISGILSSFVTIAVLVLLTLSIGLFGIDVVDESSLIKTTSEQPVDPAASD